MIIVQAGKGLYFAMKSKSMKAYRRSREKAGFVPPDMNPRFNWDMERKSTEDGIVTTSEEHTDAIGGEDSGTQEDQGRHTSTSNVKPSHYDTKNR